MDLWVVAVAAGAGCLAKYWQNISRDRNKLPAFSSGDSNCGKPESQGRPFHRLAGRKKLDDEVSADRKWVSDGRLSDMYQLDGASAAEVTSTSGFDVEKSACFEKYEDCNVLSVSSLLPGCSKNDDVEHEVGNRPSGDVSDNSGNSLPGLSPGMGSFRGSSRNRSSLRARRSYRHFLEPLSSLESCLMTQLYKEHAEVKRNVFSPPPSPSTPAMRQLFVTDGSQILSRGNGHSLTAQIGFEEDKVHKEAYLENNENVYGVTPLPKFRSLDFPKKMQKRGKVPSGRLSSSIKVVSGKHVHSRDGMVLNLIFLYSLCTRCYFIGRVNQSSLPLLLLLLSFFSNVKKTILCSIQVLRSSKFFFVGFSERPPPPPHFSCALRKKE